MLTQWELPDNLPPLEHNEVQVWRIETRDAVGSTAYFTSLLSVDEQIRAVRLRNGQVRDHFTIGRGCVRILLGNALTIDPRHVSITNGIHGKPEISVEHGLSFNIAHSKDTLLIALGRLDAIGIDVEYLDRATDIMEVSEANFTKEETSSLAAIGDPETRLRTFYRYWTRKEAIGKADGRGLLLPLASFDVSFKSMTSQPVRVNELPDKDGRLYFVSDLDLGDKAVAAIALESSDCHIKSVIFPQALHLAAET